MRGGWIGKNLPWDLIDERSEIRQTLTILRRAGPFGLPALARRRRVRGAPPSTHFTYNSGPALASARVFAQHALTFSQHVGAALTLLASRTLSVATATLRYPASLRPATISVWRRSPTCGSLSLQATSAPPQCCAPCRNLPLDSSGTDALDLLTRMFARESRRGTWHFIMDTMMAHPRTFLVIGLLRSVLDSQELVKQGSLF
jgi:hypothetical protein